MRPSVCSDKSPTLRHCLAKSGKHAGAMILQIRHRGIEEAKADRGRGVYTNLNQLWRWCSMPSLTRDPRNPSYSTIRLGKLTSRSSINYSTCQKGASELVKWKRLYGCQKEGGVTGRVLAKSPSYPSNNAFLGHFWVKGGLRRFA